MSTIQLTQPDGNGLFQRLVIAEKSLNFPLYEGKLRVSRWAESSPTEDDSDPSPASWRVRAGDIETSKSPPELDIALGRLAQLARVSLEERGVNTLYVALGMLEWRPIDGADVQRAPLLMVPVELKRETRLHPYVLSPFDEDAEINPSLIYMLRRGLSNSRFPSSTPNLRRIPLVNSSKPSKRESEDGAGEFFLSRGWASFSLRSSPCIRILKSIRSTPRRIVC